jgi:hypothetical protein
MAEPEQTACATSRLRWAILLDEVFVQCALALEHTSALGRLLTNPETRQTRMVWAHVQGFLVHAALVSKLVEPPTETTFSEARKRFLREALLIDDTSAILQRSARNNVEHFDERIDVWCQGGGSLVELIVPTREKLMFTLAGGDFEQPPTRPVFVRRALIVDEMVFVSQGRNGLEEADLKALRAEIARIADCAGSLLGETIDPAQFIRA